MLHFITTTDRPLSDDSDLSVRRQPWIMRASCERFGIELLNLNPAFVKHEPTGGYRLKLILDWILQYERLGIVASDDLLLYADCWDGFFCAPPEEIEAKLTAIAAGGRVALSAETNLYPGECAGWGQYPASASIFRYANAGGFGGRAEDVLAFFGAADFWPPEATCDQAALHWHLIHRPEPLYLDRECHLWQTLYDDGTVKPSVVPSLKVRTEDGSRRIINTLTGSRPCVVHGNGGRAMEAVQLWRLLISN